MFSIFQHAQRKNKRTIPKQHHFPSDTLAYAIGDIHGCDQELGRLLDKIREDIETKICKEKTARYLIFLGDYIDRGPNSHAVIERLLKPFQGVNTIFLRGNHEQAMLDFIGESEDGADWLRYGGLETLASYGVETPLLGDMSDIRRARTDLSLTLPQAHLEFLHSLEHAFKIGDYVFVHAGIDPTKPLDRQLPSDVLWIRERFLTFSGPLPARIIHGHTPVPEVEIFDDRINVDTGVYSSGSLSAVRILSEGVKCISATIDQ